MFKVAAIAFMPMAAVVFGVMAIILATIPGLRDNFASAAELYYGAAGLSFVLAAPLAWLTARRMLTRREKKLLDAGVGSRS